MKLAWANALALVTAVVSLSAGAQENSVRITYPPADSIVSGPTRIEATISPPSLVPRVASVMIYANGRLVCTAERQPFACPWDPGTAVRGNHLRVVATLSDGSRLVHSVWTKDLGYAEQVRTDAVLVPVIVTHHGRFVGGLREQDFEVLEDEKPQQVATISSEDSPLDLIVAIDISGSMEDALPDVKNAVKQLLAKLRPGDAVTTTTAARAAPRAPTASVAATRTAAIASRTVPTARRIRHPVWLRFPNVATASAKPSPTQSGRTTPKPRRNQSSLGSSGGSSTSSAKPFTKLASMCQRPTPSRPTSRS